MKKLPEHKTAYAFFSLPEGAFPLYLSDTTHPELQYKDDSAIAEGPNMAEISRVKQRLLSQIPGLL